MTESHPKPSAEAGGFSTQPPLADDILRGADEIAAYLFGDKDQRRRVYHLVQTGRLPVFRLGSILCARRTKLIRWIEAEEEKSTQTLTTAVP